MTPPVGSAVLFWCDGGLSLGRVLAEEKQRLRVGRPDGSDERITPGRVALIVERFPPAPGLDDDRQGLRALETTIRAAASQVDVPVLWSLVCETPGDATSGIDLEQLGPLAVGDVPPSVASAATLIAMRDERVHFERRGERWLPRSADAVAALCEERERVERRARETEALHDVLAAAVRDGSACLPHSETAEQVVAALRALALDEMAVEGRQRRIALDALAASGRAGERPGEGAFRLLRALGVFDDEDVNLQVERFAIRVEFPEPVRRRAVALAAGFDVRREADSRVDLTGLPTLSIDGSLTREIDDALSVERDGGSSPWIWTHIADCSAFVTPGDVLDREAFARGLSHYMPDLRVPMLPPEISHVAASLVEGAARPALSFGVRLAQDGSVADSRIERSVIRSDARLTYAAADALVSADDTIGSTLRELASFAARRTAARLCGGAVVLLAPDVDLHVDDRGDVQIERLAEDSTSRAIVSEAMVLAGALAAERCRAAGAPVPYRCQLPPQQRGAPDAAPVVGALEVYRRRRTLRRAEVRLEPGRHASLGVDAYCQTTSPLRRFQDLVCHRQLVSVLRGEDPPYAAAALGEVLAATGEAEQTARRAEAAARDYWRLRWLEQQGGRPLDAVVVEGGPRPRVLLDALQSVHPWGGGTSTPVGDRVALRVTRVNPRAGIVRFERAD